MGRGARQAAVHGVMRSRAWLNYWAVATAVKMAERTSENVPRYKNTPKKGKYYHNQNVIIILRVNERLVSTKNQLDKKSDWISERIANVWHCIYPRSTFGPKYEAALKNNRLYSWSLEGAKMGQEVFFFFFSRASFSNKIHYLIVCSSLKTPIKSVVIWPSDKNFWRCKGRVQYIYKCFNTIAKGISWERKFRSKMIIGTLKNSDIFLMLKLKLHYFGHLMWRADSFEKTPMLGKVEGRRRRGWQRMRRLDGITDSRHEFG